MNATHPVIVLICANTEWKAVMGLLRPEECGSTPFGGIFAAQSGRHNLLYAHSGWGKTATAAACQHLIDTRHPRLMINIGTCGGLAGHAQVGQILLAEETAMYDIVESMSDYTTALERYRTRAELGWLPGSLPPGVCKARIVSADQDIQTQNFDLIADTFHAPAADWESAAFAWTAAKNQTPWLVLRGVSDLISKETAETFQNVRLWRERTGRIMADLLNLLPWFLDCFPSETETA